MGSEVTTLLRAWRDQDDQDALDQLIPLVYEELRALAAKHMRGERAGHTLQPTALVHEAYARLVLGDLRFESRAHFFRVAARTMRRVLVDHARRRTSQKRGGGARDVTLIEGVASTEPWTLDLLALDQALDRLAELDERKAGVLEMHFFGGLTQLETATALEVSTATVERDLRLAKAWMAEQLGEEA